MPTLEQHQSISSIKLLCVGDSGSGKTGALASLANAGYRLVIFDFDNGLDILLNFVKPEFKKNVIFRTFTDTFKGAGGKLMATSAKAYSDAINYLMDWKDPPIGGAITWGPDTIIVIDSLTLFGEAAMRFALQLNGRLGQKPWQSDWGEAIGYQEDLLRMLYSTDIKCHVIINAHLTSTREGKTDKGEAIMSDKMYPSALGNKLPPKVGRYFNTMLLFKVRGTQRKILTRPTHDIDVKTPWGEAALPAELPIADGLKTIFELAKQKPIK